MGDYITKRPAKQVAQAISADRKLLPVTSEADKKILPLETQGKATSTQEKPIHTFRKLLGELSGNIGTLASLLRPKPQEASRAAVAGQPERGRDGKMYVWEHRSPTPAILNAQVLPYRGSYPVVTGADREARRQLSEPYKADSPHHLPSSARLAQILHADTLIQKGIFKASPPLQMLAQAIREGRRREVADLDPNRIQKLLHDSAGGPTKAQQMLNTPQVAKLIERHNNILRLIYNERVNNQTLKHDSVAVPAPAMSHGSGNFPTEAITVPAKNRESNSSDEQQLLTMLETNEAPHMFAQAASEREQRAPSVIEMGNEASPARISAPPITGVRGETRSPMPIEEHEVASKSEKISGQSPSAAASPSMKQPLRHSSEILPTPPAVKTGGGGDAGGSESGRRSGGNQTIRGSLTLKGANGQSLGTADLEGQVE